MSSLARFQDAFASALLTDDPSSEPASAPPDVSALVRQRAFAVYRNTVHLGLIDAIVANHPAVARLVGDEWMRAAAAVFVRSHLPRHPSLVDYGEGFDRFLAAFGPAAALPYLPPVARLDRAWSEAHAARDEPVVDPASIAALTSGELAGAALVPHAAARWAWSGEHPIHALWTRNRHAGEDADLADVAWRGEGVLVTRPRDAVTWREIGAAHAAFLGACADGRPLEDAIGAVFDVDRSVDLARLMAELLDAGAFTRLSLPRDAARPAPTTTGPNEDHR